MEPIINIIKTNFDNKNIYFINILDGKLCYDNKDKFDYLINKKEHKNVIKYIFIGDLSKFQSFWIKDVQ